MCLSLCDILTQNMLQESLMIMLYNFTKIRNKMTLRSSGVKHVNSFVAFDRYLYAV